MNYCELRGMNQETFFLQSISESRLFSDNWLPLSRFATLYVPIAKSRLGSRDDPLPPQEARDYIDICGRELHPGFRVADVFLTPDFVDSRFYMQAYPARELLARLLKNTSLQGITFHSTATSGEEVYTLYRFAVARLVGFLAHAGAYEPEAITTAEDTLSHDQVCRALHLAAEEREHDGDFGSYFPVEISALLSIGLYDHALTYLRWASTHSPRELILFQAHLFTITGEPQRAITLLSGHSASSWRLHLELGRALLFAGKAKAAAAQFDSCLASKPGHFDPLLGKGVSLRTSAWDSPQHDELDESLSYFSQVASLAGYHRPEALHHAGTVHMALEDYAEAERLFREAVALSPSPVSKRNLCLCLHAQRRFEEAYEQFSYLYRFFPEHSEGLEKYFHKRPRLIVFASEPAFYTGNIDTKVSDIRDSLKTHGVILEGDVLDFKRMDSFINYYAPAGGLIETSRLSALSNAEIAEVFGEISRCLTHTLVATGNAFWASSPHSPPEQLHVAIPDENGQPQLICMFNCVLARLQHGAETNSIYTLESFITDTPEFQRLLRTYRDPFPALPASETRVSVFESRAEHTFGLLEEYGFSLDGSPQDLYVLDSVIDALLSSHTTLAAAYTSGAFSKEELVTLGLYLGRLFRKHASGTWYDHVDGFGISLQEMPISTLYPIWRIFKRIESGVGGDGVNNISALQPSLVCAELIQVAKEEQIKTIEHLQALVSERLPDFTPIAALELAKTILCHSSANSEFEN